MSGLIADSRTMVDKARVEGQVGFFHSSFFIKKRNRPWENATQLKELLRNKLWEIHYSPVFEI